MGSSAPAAPTPPDPVATASAQAQANAGTATAQTALNNTNQVTPYGSLTYNVTGQQSYTNPDGSTSSVPTYTSTQTLSPAEQALFDQQNALGVQSNTAAGTALGTLQSSLNNPVTASNLPALRTTVGYGPNLDGSYDAGGAIQSGYDPGGALQSSYASGGAIQSGYDSGGAIQNGYASGGAIQSSYDPGGSIQTDVALDNNTPTTFGQTAHGIQYGLGNTDFSSETNAATNSVLQRLAPTMAAQGESLNASLANQGLVQGSAAWNAAQLSQSQANNDLRLGAVATGDQEQQALFGESATANQLWNAAQNQDYTQQQGRGLFGMEATAQNNAATLDMANFHNAAQGQQNSENAGAAAFSNQAQAQANSQNAAAAAFNNQAQQQQNTQNASAAAFSNQAQAQAEQENAARAAFSNATQTTQNQENAAAAAFANQAQAQQNSQNQQAVAFSNQTQNQVQQNWIDADQFANQAREQSLNDQETVNNNAVNQISALLHGGQATTGQYQGYTPGQIGTTPISQDTYSSAQLAEQNYQTESQAAAQNNAAMFSALGGLFGMGGNFFAGRTITPTGSDRRIKRDVTPLGPAANGLPLYSFRYVWDEDDAPLRTGHMAQEVMKVRPDAVYRMPAGYLAVDYGAL